MKKLLMVLVVLVVAAGAFADSTFNITAQLNSSIAIACSGTWAAGAKDAGSTATMLLTDAITVTNTSTVGVTLAATCGGAAVWTPAVSAGQNNYVLTVAEGATFADDAAVATALGSGKVLSATPAGLGAIGLNNGLVVAKLGYPTKSTTAGSQTITVTLTAGAQ